MKRPRGRTNCSREESGSWRGRSKAKPTDRGAGGAHQWATAKERRMGQQMSPPARGHHPNGERCMELGRRVRMMLCATAKECPRSSKHTSSLSVTLDSYPARDGKSRIRKRTHRSSITSFWALGVGVEGDYKRQQIAKETLRRLMSRRSMNDLFILMLAHAESHSHLQ